MRAASLTGRGAWYGLPRLIPRDLAWRVRLSLWGRSVISLRSAGGRAWRVLLPRIIFQRQPADLRLQGFDIDLSGLRPPRRAIEGIRNTVRNLIFPRLGLAGMQVKLRRRPAHRSVARQRRQRDFRLDGRTVVPSWLSSLLRPGNTAGLGAQKPHNFPVQISRATLRVRHMRQQRRTKEWPRRPAKEHTIVHSRR